MRDSLSPYRNPTKENWDNKKRKKNIFCENCKFFAENNHAGLCLREPEITKTLERAYWLIMKNLNGDCEFYRAKLFTPLWSLLRFIFATIIVGTIVGWALFLIYYRLFFAC